MSGSLPHESPPGSLERATVLNFHTSLPVPASYALMKHFSSSRYVAQELSPCMTLPFAAIEPLLAPSSPFDRLPIAVSHTCLPVRASKASRCASSVVTNTLSSYIEMPRIAAADGLVP